jgi:ferredoxin
MKINKVKLVYFSPTGTTRRILEYISEGLEAPTEYIDLTHPNFTTKELAPFRKELVIIGVPVYVGRVPTLAAKRLSQLKGNDTPAVLVVVYGNRAYEDALLELSDITSWLGFKPIAGGAFLAEHSFSSAEVPIARGRPDEADKSKAVRFGDTVREKLLSASDLKNITPVSFPGNRPYRTYTPSGGRPQQPSSPETIEDECTKCGECVEICPTGAITMGSNLETRKEACIRCHACVRVCPVGARVMRDPWFVAHTKVLHDNLVKRNEPETFL